MAYTDVPLGNQRIKDTQAPIRTNFSDLQTAFNVNHVALNAGADVGKHKFLTLPQQGSAPGATASEMTIFNQIYALTNNNQIFVKRGSAGTPFPITSSGGTSGVAGDGWSFLPSGLVAKWGVGTTSGTSVVLNVNATSNRPTMSNIQTYTITAVGAQSAFWVTAGVSATTITVNSSANNAQFKWTIIGSGA